MRSTERPGAQCPPASPGNQGPRQFCLWPVQGSRAWGFISPRAGEKPREVFSAHGQPTANGWGQMPPPEGSPLEDLRDGLTSRGAHAY